MEKAKQVLVPDWIDRAVNQERRKHRRAWNREAMFILEAQLKRLGYKEEQDLVESK
jgi:hypothetical protein